MYVCIKEEYPEVEVLWMLTKTWNCGVRFFRWAARKGGSSMLCMRGQEGGEGLACCACGGRWEGRV